MEVATFCRQSRVIVVAGKGGVGKTTTTAALALLAARHGLRVLVVELEGRELLPAAFGRKGSLGYDTEVLHECPGNGVVLARRLTPDDALVEYLIDHGLKRISKRLVSSGALDIVSTAIPGIRDILVLGKVKQMERAGANDLILIDAPATGHAMTFLTSARGLLDAARSGPVRLQASEVVEMLGDPERCQVLLVTLPEEMPVNEVIDAAYALEDRVGVALAAVVVNSVTEPPGVSLAEAEAILGAAGGSLPPDVSDAALHAAAFRWRRHDLQREQLERLARSLPLPQLALPELESAEVGPFELERLADCLEVGIAAMPGAPLGQGSAS
jgi:anion-transporting  ArsA/GET3 family ATPase